MADYMAPLQAHLARQREYPRRARQRGIEGTVTVRFTLHPDGRITHAQVIARARSAILNEAARELLERASPAPAFPDDMAQQPITLPVPIRYGLKVNRHVVL
jgi:protein TonB